MKCIFPKDIFFIPLLVNFSVGVFTYAKHCTSCEYCV